MPSREENPHKLQEAAEKQKIEYKKFTFRLHKVRDRELIEWLETMSKQGIKTQELLKRGLYVLRCAFSNSDLKK